MLYNALVENYLLEADEPPVKGLSRGAGLTDDEYSAVRKRAKEKETRELRRYFKKLAPDSPMKSAIKAGLTGGVLGHVIDPGAGAAKGAVLGALYGATTSGMKEKWRDLKSKYGMSRRKLMALAGIGLLGTGLVAGGYIGAKS